MTIERFRDDDVVSALAHGGDPVILRDRGRARVCDALDTTGDAWDPGDPYGSAMTVLGYVVDVLSGYESPEWGNVSGRFESTGHRLASEDWNALDMGCFAERDGDGPLSIGAADTPDPWALQELATYVGERAEHMVHVVWLGDLMCQVIDRCREEGTDY